MKELSHVLRNEITSSNMFCLVLLSLWLLSNCSSVHVSATAVASAQWGLTTHSPLTAFKQLGFDNNGYRSSGQHVVSGSQHIPYTISDFSDPPPPVGQNKKLQSAKAKIIKNSAAEAGNAEGFQQIRHPNDILSNMGVDLPSEEILGKLHNFDHSTLSGF